MYVVDLTQINKWCRKSRCFVYNTSIQNALRNNLITFTSRSLGSFPLTFRPAPMLRSDGRALRYARYLTASYCTKYDASIRKLTVG